MAKVYCYYRPAGSSGASSSPSAGGYAIDFGHFMIEIEKDRKRTAFDYYLEGKKSIVKQNIEEKRRRDHLYISFHISDAVANTMIFKIDSWARKPPEYDFPSDSTCVSRSNELLRMVGFDVKDAITPSGIWSGLLRKSLLDTRVWRDRSDQRLVFPVPIIPPRHGVPFPPLAPDAGLPEPSDYQKNNIVSGLRPYKNTFTPKTSQLRITPQEMGVVHPHIVKAGERIWNLAPKFGYHNPHEFTQVVMKANPGLDPRRLRVGQTINLPFKTQLGRGILSGASAVRSAGINIGIRPSLIDRQGLLIHTVRPGENLTHISRRYGTSVNDLYNANRNIIGSNKNLIHAGQQFVIPLH